MSGCIAVINAGSSSIKFALCGTGQGADMRFRGQVEGIGANPRLRVKDGHGEVMEERTWPADGFGHAAAAEAVLQTGSKLAAGTIRGIGHRVVHGGLKYDAPVRIDQPVLEDLSQLIPLAPLHQPHNLDVIRAILEVVPHIPQVACFDTAFHRSQPHVAQTFGLPRQFSTSGIRRYGFHGLSYEYLTSQVRSLYPELAPGRVIMAHLGNGASLCAVQAGRSIASTMGFTAVDGLLMGTRCGSIDPGVILHLMTEHHMDTGAIEDLIYRKSGLLGVSGISSDMRALRASSDPKAREAIELFVYRIVREVGSLVAAMGGLDALIFAGGIGENDPKTRAEVVAGCQWTGIVLDDRRNVAGIGRISRDDSRIPALVIATDEERLIASHTQDLLKL